MPTQIGENRAKKMLKANELVLCMGVNQLRTPNIATPDRLLLTRPENRHLSFGLGVHFCLGAALARLEGEIAFSTLFKRFPHLRLETDAVEWQPSMVFRGLKQLPVSFT